MAKKADTIYFIEVKFRSSNNQGDGFDYINWAKLKQMSYAAKFWAAKNNWQGKYCLSAASVSADRKVNFIEQLIT